MKSMLMAAVVVQLSTAGGAGGASGRSRPGGADVGRSFSALKQEWGGLKRDFEQARERARVESEAKRQSAEGGNAPKPQRADVTP
ncbi:hypothetical protein P2318_12850 [Myxococcaceae bacterium GXIMD 01537]